MRVDIGPRLLNFTLNKILINNGLNSPRAFVPSREKLRGTGGQEKLSQGQCERCFSSFALKRINRHGQLLRRLTHLAVKGKQLQTIELPR